MECPLFVDYAKEVLERRAREGIRGIDHERNRFATHIEGASFAGLRLDAIRARDLRNWTREMQDKKAKVRNDDRLLATDTVKRAFSFVSAVFSAAVDDDLVEANPAAGVKIKRRIDVRSTKAKWTVLTLEEQKAVAACEAIPYADRLAIRFAIATGLRQGEQFALELPDIHIWPGIPHVHVRLGKPGLPPKSGKPRKVPLMKEGLVVAQQWLAHLPTYAATNPHGIVFPYHTGSRRSVGKPLGHGGRLKQHLAKVGITRRVRWHDLRHTFCSNLVTGALGVRWSLEEIRELAGHSSVTITERYAHMDERELAKRAEETVFSHEPMPLVDVNEERATERDVTAWFEEAS